MRCRVLLRVLVVAVVLVAALVLASVALAGYPATVSANAPEAYWRLGEPSGTTLVDTTGNGHGGSYVGSVSLGVAGGVIGDADTAVNLPSTAGFGEVPYSAALNPSGAFTVEALVKPGSVQSSPDIGFDPRPIVASRNASMTQGYMLYFSWYGSSPQFAFIRGSDSGSYQYLYGGPSVQVGNWYHVVGVWDGSTLRLYVNGVDSGATPIGSGGMVPTTSGSLLIGLCGACSGSGKSFQGTIDEVAVYPGALSPSDVAMHYAEARAPMSPASGATVTAQAATFETPELPNVVAYQFQITTSDDTGFASPVSDSGWLPTTNTFLPPEDVLIEGQSYLWRSRSKDSGGGASAWSAATSFTYGPKKLGARDYWPMWSNGSLSVNQANGNLVLSLPGPSFPTGVGSLGASFTLNTHDSSNAFGLGAGWTMSAGSADAAPPAKLIDRSLLRASERQASVARVSADGSTDDYRRVGSSTTYLAVAGDGSQLAQNADGSWTLIDPDGSVYSFAAADPLTGEAQLTRAEVLAIPSGKAKYVYTYASGKVTGVTLSDDQSSTFSSLALDWSCSAALVCITGPDGQVWRYIGQSGATGRLAKVSDGTRDVAEITYDGSGLPTAIKDANDLDPTNANISPGYLSSHTIAIGYDTSTPARVTSVSDGPFRNRRYGTVTQLTSTWSFAYEIPCSVSRHNPAQTHGFALPAAAGCTTVTPPGQQGAPSPKKTRVLWDVRSHPVEAVDVFGNYRLIAYNARDQLLWSEDEDGNPTDFVYDPVDFALVSVTGPDPDAGGPLGRPVTSYRQDEKTIGTASTPGAALEGLRAAYFDNPNLAGRPRALQTDPNVDFDWGTGAPPALPGVTSNYSVRWSGELVVATAGDYTFTTTADFGTRLTIRDADGTGKANLLAIKNWQDQGVTSVSSQPITLSAGRHAFTLDYYAKTTTASSQVRLQWACGSCGIAQQAVPQASLRPAWLNQTSVLTPGATVTPSTRIAFTHYAQPETGNPDYGLVQVGGQDLITSYTYDAFGRLTAKVMPKGNGSRSIDANGNLTGSVTPGFQTTWAYYTPGETATPSCAGAVSANQAGLLKSLTRDGITAITTAYDAAGRPRSVTNAKGTACRRYDAEGRLTSEQAASEAQPTTYTYDPAGQQRTATDAAGTITSEYNEQGASVRGVDSFGSEAAPVYDKAGNVLAQDVAAGSIGTGPVYTTQYGYDDGDRPTTLTDPAGRQYSFLYDTRSNLRATQYPNGTFTWTDVNPAGGLAQLVNRHGTLGSTLPASPPADANPVADYAYTYYGNGQRKDETRTAGGLATEASSYVYDEVGRLSQVTLPTGVVRDYLFDKDSNRTQIKENSATVATYTYDPATTPGVDQLTSVAQGGTTAYAYTGDGQVATRGSDSLTWDGRGRLSGGTFAGQAVSYGFDAAGLRRQRTVAGATTQYRQGGLLETDTSGTILRFSVSGPMGDLAHYLGAPTTSAEVGFLYYSGHGDTAAQADLSGARTQILSYDPFGVPRTPLDLSEYRAFTSQNIDAGCSGCALTWQANGEVEAKIAGAADTSDTAEGKKDFGGASGYTGRVFTRTVLRLPAGQTTNNSLYVFQVRDAANALVYELYLTSGRVLKLKSPAGGLRATAIDSTTSFTVPNDGATTARVEVSALKNSSVIVRVNGTDRLTITGLSGATTGNQRYLVAGINRYDGSQAQSKRVFHAKLWATTQGWPGDGTTSTQALERYTGRFDKKLDPASSLVEMGARPYDPNLGRFLAADPVEGGSLNAYDYAAQDPVTTYDLTGLDIRFLPRPSEIIKKAGRGIAKAKDAAKQWWRGAGREPRKAVIGGLLVSAGLVVEGVAALVYTGCAAAATQPELVPLEFHCLTTAGSIAGLGGGAIGGGIYLQYQVYQAGTTRGTQGSSKRR